MHGQFLLANPARCPFPADVSAERFPQRVSCEAVW